MIQRRFLSAGAVLVLLAAGSAHAAELIGTPFSLARKVDASTYRGPYLTARDNGEFDYVYDVVDSTAEPATHKVFLQSLDRFGAPKSDPTLVVASDSPLFNPGGSLPLPTGGSFVGYARKPGDLSAAFGRTVGADGVVGDETLIDDRDRSNIYIARMLTLPSNSIVITDGGYHKSKTGRTNCNFVDADGSITRPQADITFGNKNIRTTTKYQDGMIVSYNRGANNPDYFNAQIVDGQCNKIGAPKSVLLHRDGVQSNGGYALGLTDGTIAVLRFFYKKTKGFVTVQLFDGAWTKKTPELVLDREVLSYEIGFAAIADGRIAVAAIAKNKDGAPTGIDVQVYNKKLKPVGSAAKMTGLPSPTIQKLDLAPDGKLILVYAVTPNRKSRVDIYGQLIGPDM